MKRWMSLAAALLICAAPAWAATYEIDKDHSAVSFKIRHLFSNVPGNFNDFGGRFTYEPGKPETWQVDATIQTASIDTNNAKRDEHLRTADFFDAAAHPTITFKSAKVTDVTQTSAKLHGVLNMHGVEKPVVLDVTIHGEGKDPWGNVRAGFTATTKLNRKDFGIVWNKALETGEVLLGDEIDILIEIEGLRKEEAAASGAEG
jgi:polyisoprenoid-binding protein YceI